MAGFGERFRIARENKGLSFEFIEEETKIRKMYLEALEQERFELLPPRVYAIGFVKKYAHFLDLNVEEVSREFKELAYGAGNEVEQPAFRAQKEKSSVLAKFPVKNLFIAAAFLLLVIWAGSFLVDYINSSVKNQNISKTPTTNDKHNVPQKNPEQVTKPVNKTLDMTIKIKKDMKSWVLVQVDGEEKLQGVLNSGQEQSFKAKQSIYIKTGNAGAVDIFINNKKQEPLGVPGEVKEKEYEYGGKY